MQIPPDRQASVTPKITTVHNWAEFSTIVESSGVIAVDRTMTWDTLTRYGSHSETAVVAPSATWYLAEGE